MQGFYVGYSWIMINNLTTECYFEIVNLSKTRIYYTKLYINSVISFIRIIIIPLWINNVYLRTKSKFFFLLQKIKNLLRLTCQ